VVTVGGSCAGRWMLKTQIAGSVEEH